MGRRRSARGLAAATVLALLATAAGSAAGTSSAAAAPPPSSPVPAPVRGLPSCETAPARALCVHTDERPATTGAADALVDVAPPPPTSGPGVGLDWYDGEDPVRPPWDVLCTGSGTDGPRLRIVYYRASDQQALDPARRTLLERVAAESDRRFFLAAESRGEGRRLRWATTTPEDGACRPTVHEVVGPPGSPYGSPGRAEALTADSAFHDPDVLTVVFIDGTAGPLMGYAQMANDDRPGLDNPNATGGRHLALFRAGWTVETATHELAHLLGAVQASAPHADAGHCTDGNDVLCYHGDPATAPCPLPPRQLFGVVDCGGDDYYHPLPPPGSYLDQHWNTADSPFLERVPTAGPTPSTAITSGGGQVVLPNTGFSLTARDSAPTGAFLDPGVRRWTAGLGCRFDRGTPATGTGWCSMSTPGLHEVPVGHLAVDRFDRTAVATATVRVQVPDHELPTALEVVADRPSVPPGEVVTVTATFRGQAPDQSTPTTPLVDATVELSLDGTAPDGHALEVRRGRTDTRGRFTTTFRVLEPATVRAHARVYGVWQPATDAVDVDVEPSDLPAAPRRVSALARAGGAEVRWEDPPGGAPSGLSGWEVVDGSGRVLATAGAAARSALVEGLPNGVPVDLSVRTVAEGRASLPAVAASVTPLAPPSAPAAPTAWSHPQEVRASWLPPEDTGGGADLRYQARLDPSGAVVEVPSGEEAAIFTGVADGEPATVSVRARHDLAEWGPWSEPSAPVTAASPPGPPREVRAEPLNAAAVISWEPPADDGGSPVTGYMIRNLATGGAIAVGADARSATYPDLENGRSYSFAVSARNREGGRHSAASGAVVPSVAATRARAVDDSCPDGAVPAHGFSDVPPSLVHAPAIACLVWWEVARGTSATSYAPDDVVTRAAMAAFVSRAVLAAGGSLPSPAPDAFSDDETSVHEAAIDQLAAAGLVHGTGGGGFAPSAPVTRGQMAKFLVGAAEHVHLGSLPAGDDAFTDDTGSLFEHDINRLARGGLTGGRPDGGYAPQGLVTRAQMASFLARLLDLAVERGSARPGS